MQKAEPGEKTLTDVKIPQDEPETGPGIGHEISGPPRQVRSEGADEGKNREAVDNLPALGINCRDPGAKFGGLMRPAAEASSSPSSRSLTIRGRCTRADLHRGSGRAPRSPRRCPKGYLSDQTAQDQ
jgi:hypothetical protein